MDEFDDIRKKLDSYGEQPDEKVWKGIEARLDKTAKPSWWRRPVCWTAAAAACLTAAFFIFRKPEPALIPLKGSETQQVAVVEGPSSKEDDTSLNQNNTSSLSAESVKKSLASASLSATAPADGPVSLQETAPSAEAVPAREQTASNAPVSKEKTEEAAAPKKSAYPKEWDEPDEVKGYVFPTSLIAVNSNVGAGLGSNSFSYDGGAMFVSAKDGSYPQSVSVVQMGAGKYSMPLTFGAQAQVSFGNFAIGAGLSYTYLHSEYPALVNQAKYTVDNNVSYLGIPVTVYYHFIKQPRFSIYGNLGGMVEACLYAGGKYGSTSFTYDISHPLFSVMGGIGCEYRLTEFLGVYFEPGFVYFINCTDDAQPVSIRTAQPMQLRTELGLRIHLNY
jgi:hypothetical protein